MALVLSATVLSTTATSAQPAPERAPDENNGFPYNESWGMRFSGGFHLD